MNETGRVVDFCLKPLRNSPEHAELDLRSFDVRFEIFLVVFLASLIDGRKGVPEQRLLEEVGRQLEWSSLEQQLLRERAEKLPDYSFDYLHHALKHTALAASLYRLARTATAIDAPPGIEERFFLDDLRSALRLEDGEPRAGEDRIVDQLISGTLLVPPSQQGLESRGAEALSPDTIEAVFADLDAMVGLQGVKDEVRRLAAFLKIQKERAVHELKSADIALHMVFGGNPGTGKTSIARLVARLYRALGVVNRGHLIETDRSGLVGQYVGHTAQKTNAAIDRALDGILFIDEAYSLIRGLDGNDFGREAVDTLVKRMEDDRKRLVVIVAGYPEEMETFIDSNPGLRSRFNTYLHFADYSATELMDIFQLLCQKNEYLLNSEAERVFLGQLQVACDRGETKDGNGRYVRNLFENIIRNHALRLSAEMGPISRDRLRTIQVEDIGE